MERRRGCGPAGVVAVAVVVGCGGCDRRTGIVTADGQLVSDQSAVDFGPVALHAAALRRVPLVDLGMASVQVVSAASSGPDGDEVRVDVPDGGYLQAGETAQATVEFRPVRVGSASAQLAVAALDPDPQSVAVAVTGEGVDARAAIAPSVLDFGKVEMGSTATRELVASDASVLSTRVVLVPAGPDASEISIAPDVVEVAGGASQSISVSWTPTAQRSLDAWIEALPCAFCQAAQISLSGTAIPYELIAVPARLDFGAVPKDFAVEKQVALENVSTHDVQVLTLSLPGSSTDFSIDSTKLPVTLGPGGALQPAVTLPPGGDLEVGITYLTASLQAATGTLEVTSTDTGHPTLDVPLTGNVAGALIAVAPTVIDFGVVPLGAKPQKDLVIENQGSGADLHVYKVFFDPGSAPQLTLGVPAFPVTLHPTQTLTIPVYFEPDATPKVGGTIEVYSDDPYFGDVQVAVMGSARTTLPCQLDLVPPQVDFGTVPLGGGAVLAFHAVDVGPDVCVLRHLQIDPFSDPGFELPGGNVDSFVFNPGEFAQAQVAFRPARTGLANGAVSFTINDPANPEARLPLIGGGGGPTPEGATPCLAANPAWLDFGAIQPGCPTTLALGTQFENDCGAPVAVSKIYLGQGTTADFAIAARPGTPLTVPPGGRFPVTVRYAPKDQGMQAVPLFVVESDVPRPSIVPVLGEVLPPGLREDDFTQQSAAREDVLFVIANTGSMRTKMPAVLAAVPAFADALAATGLDYHVGVTTTGLTPGLDTLWACNGGVEGAEAGRLFPADGSAPRILDRTIGDLATALADDLQVGYCQYYQQGLTAMQLALTPPLSTSAKDPGTPQPNDGNAGFLRDDASLAVVAVSDDDDYSALPEADYLATLTQLSGWGTQRRVSFSAVVDVSGCPQDTRVGQRYLDVAKATAGLQEDLCAADLSPAFAALAQQASALQLVFPLSETPQPATIAVTVNGVAATGWQFVASQNAVVFQTGAAPLAGSQIAITYQAQCQ
ncbi:MAG: choice-of-anchor D domain-containing protein [Myxococcales bacterium]